MELSKKIDTFGKILSCSMLGKKTPIACHYSVTNRCPWRCKYCSFSMKDKAECTTAQAREIISSLARNGNVRLHLVGGEPALREDLGELVKEAKRGKLYVTMATTGYRFPQIWERIKDIDLFFMSFDGPKEVHDEQRGAGALDTLFTAIDLLRSMSKEFWTTTVITKKNIGHIDYVLETARKMKFKVNFHLLYFTSTDTYLDNSIHPSSVDTQLAADGDYRRALRHLLKRKESDMKDVIASSASYLKCLSEWKDYSRVYSEERSRWYLCWAGKMHCYIDANGDLYPCADVMGKVEPRSILKLGFEKAFGALPPVPCRSCLVACYNELNMLFSLRPDVVLNWNRKV
jgi:MoaA/NifB/PqqE/SkfB family radical SAM enzyme